MENLRLLRTEAGLTQKKLAELIGNGITQTQIYCYEHGKYSPCIMTMKKMADVLNTSMDYLVGRITYDHMAETVNESGLTRKEQKLINRFRRYRESQQQSVEKYMDLLEEEIIHKD